MKRLTVFAIACGIIFLSMSNAYPNCGTVDDNLALTLPCVEYNGIQYQVGLDFFVNPADPDGLYWKLSTVAMSSPDWQYALVEDNLDLEMSCVEYMGVQYQVRLDFYSNRSDPVGLYWKFGNIGVRDPNLDSTLIKEIMQRGELRVGLEAGYGPFEMVDQNGDFSGFDVDLANEIAKAMGVNLVIVNTPWDGIIDALLSNAFDIIISSMSITPEREIRVDFTDPYFGARSNDPLGWAIRKGDPQFLNWLNRFLKQIKKDGRYDAIYEKWF